MKWLKKLAQAWGMLSASAPLLPIPDKAKRVIAKSGEVEQDVREIVETVKSKAPAIDKTHMSY